jgi:hypothetical protein
MNRSTKTYEEILDEVTTPRPIHIPNAIVGYFGDLIIELAKHKINKIIDADKKVAD